jgi:hypothetical protein
VFTVNIIHFSANFWKSAVITTFLFSIKTAIWSTLFSRKKTSARILKMEGSGQPLILAKLIVQE